MSLLVAFAETGIKALLKTDVFWGIRYATSCAGARGFKTPPPPELQLS